MEVLNIVGMGLIAAILVVVLKEERPEMAIQVSILVGIIIFILMVNKISLVISILEDLSRKVNIDFIYFSTILKIIGIAYITEFGAQICRDAGSGTIASKIEFAGKILIILLSVPIIVALLEMVLKIMP
ncbi:MAG: stage III sporulation protein AD [Firmicutes bacterium]|nr:stage III sporulation protein AD [Bacillota bacterium]